MPLRPWTRDREGVLPPKLDDWVAADHPVRFVAAFVEELTAAEWAALGIAPGGHPGGAPAYDPAVLLAAWLYGFMSGVRSCRKLATACAEQVPFLWLTGGQRPDHNTLWRFYQRARPGMHALFKRTVATAAASGLVVWAIQAVDGTKIGGNAAKDRTLDAAALGKLLDRVDQAIADLEAQNRPDGPPTPPPLPADLAQAEALRDRVRAALDQVTAPDGPTRLNLTDPEAGLVKGRHGIVAGYNAQAVVARVALPSTAASRPRPARLLTAVAVIPEADDHGQLLPMLARVDATTGHNPTTVLADGGYHDGATVAGCAARGVCVVMPEAQQQAVADPFHKEHFAYDTATDTFTCAAGHPLPYRGTKARTERPAMRVYRGTAAVCRACPHFGDCTKDARQGRALEVGPHEAALRARRAWMATDEAQTLVRQRKAVVEPVFGVLKEELGARRFLLRGRANVDAEWTLLATALNLRTCVRLWHQEREQREAA
jgi:transposase